MAFPFEHSFDPVIAEVNPQRDERNYHYPLEVWFFLASFIFLVSVINWADVALGYLRARRQQHKLAQQSAPEVANGRGSIDLLRLPLALTDTFRALSFRWTIPIGSSYSLNVMQIFVVATYISIIYGWAFHYSKAPKDWANLTARIAAIQFPLIVSLGMKNNIIAFLTGVSFEKLNYLHRWVARVVMVLIWVHASTRMWLGLAKTIGIPGIRTGIPACLCLTLLCLVGIRPIRSKAYEVFLFVHLSLAATSLLCLYFHNANRHVTYYSWPAILLWSLDRFTRMCRLLISYFTTSKVESLSGPKISSSPKIELLPGRVIRLTAATPKFFHWRPGQSAYVTIPKISGTPLEGHPFTISAIDAKSSRRSELKFLIQDKRGKGFTRRLYDSDGTSPIGKVLIDGPYSTPPRLNGYDTVLLIASGSGVTFTLPLLLDLIERSKTNGIPCRRLTFAWTIRYLEHITWIQEDLLDALKDIPPNLGLNVHVFVSNKSPHNTLTDLYEDPEKLEDDAGSSQKVEQQSEGDAEIYEKRHVSDRLLSLPMIKIHQQRADLAMFIKDEVALAQDCMSVNVCGSVRLSRTVRASIRKPRMNDILRGGPTISLHVESFDTA